MVGATKDEEKLIETTRSYVFKKSVSLEGVCAKIQGYDFNKGVNYEEILKSLGSTGFQASNLGHAIDIVNHMLEWRLSHEEVTQDGSEDEKSPAYKESVKCKIFLGVSSNLVASGVRDMIRYLAQHHMVDVIVTEAGGIEHDIMKCLAETYIGDFSLPGAALRAKGLNRIGNLLVPDDNYRKLEEWIFPIFDQMLEEQETQHVLWTPSKLIARLGKEINNESSYLYWAYKNNIPVFCPDLTVATFGTLLSEHYDRKPGLIIHMTQDAKAMENEVVHANPRKTGMIILGGGSSKVHICHAHKSRNGADYAVFINPAQEFDGSESGASPEQAVSSGQVSASAEYVKVHCDATIAFLLLVAGTFAATIENSKPVESKESHSLECVSAKVHGYDFNQGLNFKGIFKSLVSTGFQATNLGEAIETVNQMLDWRLSHEQITQDCSKEEKNPTDRDSVRCKIFLGFTSNLISSGIRDIIRYLAQHRMVDVIVTTTGGIEEDIMKCLADTYKGDFSLPGADLRENGINRIGNLLVPNDNYIKFEKWVNPIFDKMLEEQNTQHVSWTPSKLTARLGNEINNKSSYLYWAYKNGIPVYCPGITDGSLGDILHVQNVHNTKLSDDAEKGEKLVVDVVQDITAMNLEAEPTKPRKTGMIILGGGIPKHHICNANLMRNGADYAVFINTAQEFDGSDSGARPDEAVSWGKICASAKAVKVHCDATIAFPFLVAETFAATREKAAEPKPSS